VPFDPKDYYFKKAKAKKYVARSIFKLEEIDDRFKLLKKGNKVLDLGAAPGSWSQYCSEKVGPQGRVVGLDLKEIHLTLPNAVFLKADILEIDPQQIIDQTGITPPFHCVLSDMAPKTTGVKFTDQARSHELCQMALRVAQKYLIDDGHFVAKLFHGEDFEAFRGELRSLFKKVEVLRPKSTRKQSKEIFLMGLGFKG